MFGWCSVPKASLIRMRAYPFDARSCNIHSIPLNKSRRSKSRVCVLCILCTRARICMHRKAGRGRYRAKEWNEEGVCLGAGSGKHIIQLVHVRNAFAGVCLTCMLCAHLLCMHKAGERTSGGVPRIAHGLSTKPTRFLCCCRCNPNTL